jgi:DNA polymerase III subunit alpha
VRAPDVNLSGVGFEVADGRIAYALAALKGVGHHAVEHIVAARGERPFADLADFAARIDPRLVGRKALECLVQAGAFDSLEPDRALVFANLPRIIAAAQEQAERQASGVGDLFGDGGGPAPLTLASAEPWTPAELLQREFAAIGAYLSAHPIEAYADLVKARGGMTWKAFADQARSGRLQAAVLAGTVVQRQERRLKNGGRLGIVTLTDPSGQFEATAFQEKLAEWRDLLEPGNSLILQVRADYDAQTEDLRVRIMRVEPLEEVAASHAQSLRVVLDTPEPIERLAGRLDEGGDGSVHIVLRLADRGHEVDVKLPGGYRVTPQVAGALQTVPGVVRVEIG